MFFRFILFVCFLVLISNVSFSQKPQIGININHTSGINSISLSKNEKYLLTSDDNTAKLWDVISGKLIYTLKNNTNDIKSAKFSPNEKQILTFGGRCAMLWETSTGELIHTFESDNYDLSHSSFSPDGNFIFTISIEGVLKIWESNSKKLFKKIKNRCFRSVTKIKFSPNNNYLILESIFSSPKIIDVKNGELIYSLDGHYPLQFIEAEFSKDNNLIISTGDSIVRVWETKSGKLLLKLIGHSKRITSVEISNDCQFIVTSSEDNTARIWESKTGKQIKILSKHNSTVWFAKLNFDNNNIMTLSHDKKVCLWDFKSDSPIQTLLHETSIENAEFSKNGKYILTTEFTNDSINGSHRYVYLWEITSGKLIRKIEQSDAIFMKNGSQFLTLSNDNIINIWNTTNGELIQSFKGYNSNASAITCRPDGKFLLISFNDSTLKLVDNNTGKIFKNLNLGTNEITSEFSKNNKFILTANYEKIMIWDSLFEKILHDNIENPSEIFNKIEKIIFSKDSKYAIINNKNNSTLLIDLFNGRLLNLFESNITNEFNKGIMSAEFSPIENEILLVSNNDTLNIFAIAEGELKNKIKVYSKNVVSAKYSIDGDKIITQAYKTIKIFNKNSGKVLADIKSKYVSNNLDLVLNPNGKQFLSTDFENRITLWDINTHKLLHKLEGHKESLKSAVFNQNGTLLITVSYDNEIILWDTKSGNCLHSFYGNSGLFSPNEKYIITVLDNGSTIYWDISTGKIIYTRIQLKSNDWLAYDEHYRFDGTPGAIEQLYFTCGLEVVELNQVKDSLYVPNLVQRIVNGENLNHLPKLSDLQICGVTPLVEPLDEKNYKYRITPRTGDIGDIDVYINGVVRQSLKANKLKKDGDTYILDIEPALIKKYSSPGEKNQIKVIAKTSNNSISSRGVSLEWEYTENKELKQPSVHAVMIGIDDYRGEELDLNYAAKDANDFQMALQLATKKYFNVADTNKVHFYNLTINRNSKTGTDKIKGITPDRGAILNTLQQIEKNSNPEDVFILFFAGHGEILDKDQLLLLTTESGKDNFQGIRMRELLEQVNKIPAGKRILILDACHSGAAINSLELAQYTGKRDVKDAELKSQRLKELDKLANKSGFAIITASSSDQKALELPQYEHGLLTYALLNTMLNNKNAVDEDNRLQLDKWLLETGEEMKKISKDQSAEKMVPISFIVGKIDDEVRNAIVLKEIPTVYIENVLNKTSFKDNLNIKLLLANAFQESSRGVDNKIMIADNPNAIKVNILYEEKSGDVKANVVLLKQNFEENFELNGKTEQINKFIEELMNQIKIKIQK